MTKTNNGTKDITNELWWKMMVGGQKNNKQGELVSLWLMKLLNKANIH